MAKDLKKMAKDKKKWQKIKKNGKRFKKKWEHGCISLRSAGLGMG